MTDSIEIERIPEVTIQDFAERQGVWIQIRERRPSVVQELGESFRFYATFKPSVQTKVCPGHPVLYRVAGNGRTPQEALGDLCRSVEGKYLVIEALSSSCIGFYAPEKLVAAPLEEKR